MQLDATNLQDYSVLLEAQLLLAIQTNSHSLPIQLHSTTIQSDQNIYNTEQLRQRQCRLKSMSIISQRKLVSTASLRPELHCRITGFCLKLYVHILRREPFQSCSLHNRIYRQFGHGEKEGAAAPTDLLLQK